MWKLTVQIHCGFWCAKPTTWHRSPHCCNPGADKCIQIHRPPSYFIDGLQPFILWHISITLVQKENIFLSIFNARRTLPTCILGHLAHFTKFQTSLKMFPEEIRLIVMTAWEAEWPRYGIIYCIWYRMDRSNHFLYECVTIRHIHTAHTHTDRKLEQPKIATNSGIYIICFQSQQAPNWRTGLFPRIQTLSQTHLHYHCLCHWWITLRVEWLGGYNGTLFILPQEMRVVEWIGVFIKSQGHKVRCSFVLLLCLHSCLLVFGILNIHNLSCSQVTKMSHHIC